MAVSNKLKRYEAPKGYVYDYAEPKMAKIKNVDGTISEEQEHLYAKFLFLGKFDNIESYILVKDPKYKEA